MTPLPDGPGSGRADVQREHERLRDTFERAPVGILHIGLDGVILDVNPRLCELHHRPREALIGQSVDALSERPNGMAQPEVQDLLAGRRRSYTAVRRFVRPDGATWPARVSVTLVQGSTQTYFVSLVEDLTLELAARERIETQARELDALNASLEQRIRQRTAELERSNDELRTLAYSLAHDLRAPLATLDGFLGELERHLGGGTDDRTRHFLARLRHGSDQVNALTAAWLALAHAAHDPLTWQSVDLSAIAREWHRRAIAQPRDRPPAVEIADTLRLQGDLQLLTTLLEHLLDNAWKFTRGRQDACIAFGAEPGPSAVPVFYVRDNGAGFDAAYADRLFTPFRRLHAQHEYEGAGMGLAIARKIAQRHGGDCWAEGAEGAGATLRFTLGAPDAAA